MKKWLIILSVIIFSVIVCSWYVRNQWVTPVNDGIEGAYNEEPLSGTGLNQTQHRPLKGVSLSPKSYQGQDFADFFVKAGQAGDMVTWAGDWGQLGDEDGAPHVVAKLARQHGLESIIIATYFHQSTGELVRPMNESTRQLYLQDAVNFVKAFKPRYIGFGIEVNSLYEVSPETYAGFVELFSELYPSIKDASPNTTVFTVFQLERMKGLHGGLFGGRNSVNLSQWSLLDDFRMVDMIAFTTYPCLIYRDPSEIPNDYYLEIREHTLLQVAFVEVGWFRDGPQGWESDQEEQATFIQTFFDLTEELKPQVLVWSFMYDQDIQEPFDSMGLLDRDEAYTEAWDAWLGVS